MKPKLQLVASNKFPQLIVKSNSLIESAFCMVGKYFGVPLENVYYESICLLDRKSKFEGFFPQNHNYIVDSNLWKSKVILNEIEILDREFRLVDEPKRKLSSLVNYYASFPNNVVPNLNSQETFDYATYLFFKDFLRFISNDETLYPFPKVEDILKEKNLSPLLEHALSNLENLVILPNPDPIPNMCFGIRE
ncbi:MAG: hypothetical protein KC550_03880 [Nanoarchaeota archaeon]|nr:hypothetical protein [Nanoarchaeota archaeon]